jgi:hypothetical protein
LDFCAAYPEAQPSRLQPGLCSNPILTHHRNHPKLRHKTHILYSFSTSDDAFALFLAQKMFFAFSQNTTFFTTDSKLPSHQTALSLT